MQPGEHPVHDRVDGVEDPLPADGAEADGRHPGQEDQEADEPAPAEPIAQRQRQRVRARRSRSTWVEMVKTNEFRSARRKRRALEDAPEVLEPDEAVADRADLHVARPRRGRPAPAAARAARRCRSAPARRARRRARSRRAGRGAAGAGRRAVVGPWRVRPAGISATGPPAAPSACRSRVEVLHLARAAPRSRRRRPRRSSRSRRWRRATPRFRPSKWPPSITPWRIRSDPRYSTSVIRKRTVTRSPGTIAAGSRLSGRNPAMTSPSVSEVHGRRAEEGRDEGVGRIVVDLARACRSAGRSPCSARRCDPPWPWPPPGRG